MTTRPWDEIAKFMEMSANPANEIMVLPYGSWSHRWYGEIAIDDRDGAECVSNFEQEVAGQKIPIEFADHMSSDLGAAGWYKQLRAGDDGVYATIDWTPQGQLAINEARYLYHSPEVYLRCLGQKFVRSSDRRVYSNLITGDSVTNHPFFKELGPLSDAQFSETRAHERQQGPTIFRVPTWTPGGEEEHDMANLFNRKSNTEVPSPGSATQPNAPLPYAADGVRGKEGTTPENLVSGAQFAELMGKFATLETTLTTAQAKITELSEGRQADSARLVATQSELARRDVVSQLSALRFSDGAQVLTPAHVTRCANFMAKLSSEAASFCAAEGEAPATSMQAEFIAIVSDLPSGLVEFGERGFQADPEAILDANARYEAAVTKAMADDKQGGGSGARGAAMEKVNATAPELAKAVGIG